MKTCIPYGRQFVDEDDVQAVVQVLRSGWLTQGPQIEAFELAFAKTVGARFAVVVNSGTAALHAAMHALEVGSGDEVIVPPMTFAATANSIVFQGGIPIFADVDPEMLTVDPVAVESQITKRTKAIIAVDYGGHPCNYDDLQAVADRNGICLVADACHALGATYKGRLTGTLAKLSVFSFHPVKHITTGEGGMITTDDADLAQRMRDFRTHGITKDPQRFSPADDCSITPEQGAWYYEMQDLGYNYRLSDINCALGLSQLNKLNNFVRRRREIAAYYAEKLGGLYGLSLPVVKEWAESSWHLYPVRIDFQGLGRSRSCVMSMLREKGIGTQVHYIPVYLQPFYRNRFEFKPGLCPHAEVAYGELLSLPMFPSLTQQEVERVVDAVISVLTN